MTSLPSRSVLQTKILFLPLVLLLVMLPSQSVWADPMQGRAAGGVFTSAGPVAPKEITLRSGVLGSEFSPGLATSEPLLTGSLAAGAEFGAGSPFRTQASRLIAFQHTSVDATSGESLIPIPVPEPSCLTLCAAGFLVLTVSLMRVRHFCLRF